MRATGEDTACSGGSVTAKPMAGSKTSPSSKLRLHLELLVAWAVLLLLRGLARQKEEGQNHRLQADRQPKCLGFLEGKSGHMRKHQRLTVIIDKVPDCAKVLRDFLFVTQLIFSPIGFKERFCNC